MEGQAFVENRPPYDGAKSGWRERLEGPVEYATNDRMESRRQSYVEDESNTVGRTGFAWNVQSVGPVPTVATEGRDKVEGIHKS